DILADVVVVRGEHALPPRQPLQIQLPEEARQAAESQAQEQQAQEQQAQGQQSDQFNPFERGPEITETR
ncbi:MAG: DUF3710 domain-containing protein, partial [Actinobacteria bacterium]|nr:DUF3710 domain-containing protein [Actinomycetota bacterium]